jgi:hypothetical protein
MSYIIFPDCGCKFKTKEDLPEDVVVSDNLGEHPAIELDISNIPKDCKRTWDLLCSGDTKGVFQLESFLGLSHSKQIKPRNIEELSDVIAIIRPSCLDASFGDPPKSVTKHYIDRKNGSEEVAYPCEAIVDILKPTYGINVYQEQSLRIANKLAGFSLEKADELRKAIGHKISELMSSLEKEFLDGCRKVGLVSDEKAIEIFDGIKAAQKYQFNLCISGDTKLLQKNNSKRYNFAPTIAEMYKIRNDIDYAKSTGHLELHKKWKRNGNYCTSSSMCDDLRIRPNIIKDIRYSGKQDVYKVTLENGTSNKFTINHKFPTARGELPLSEISIGDFLYVCGDYDKNKSRTYRYSDIKQEDFKKREKSCKNHRGFKNGEENYAYTNGAFTEYIKNKQLLDNKCYECGKSPDRLETHHVNGDRSDSSLDNLVNLCVSCHKKAHYKNGRTRKGQKGYPTALKTIVAIDYVGEEEVYDVEMEGPNHNFVTSTGIVTSNSHSISYSMLSYYTAYIKAHFPLQFYCSWLQGAKWKIDPSEEKKSLVNAAKKFNIEVCPPSLANDETDFHIKDKKIYFGVSNIKNVGAAAIDKIKGALQHTKDMTTCAAADWTWLSFLFYFADAVSSTVVESLISAGAADYLKLTRQRMLYEYNLYQELTVKEKEWCQTKYLENNWHKLADALEAVGKTKADGGGCHGKARVAAVLGLLESLRNPPHSLEDSILWLSATEEKLLGIALTTHKTEGRPDVYKATHSVKQFQDDPTQECAIIAAEITQLKKVVTKRGKNPGQEMAFLDLEDRSGKIEGLVCFPNVWETYEDILFENNTVLARLERNKKKEGFLLQELWQI